MEYYATWLQVTVHSQRVVSCRDMGSRTSCLSECVHSARMCSSVHEGSHVWAIQRPDSWFAEIMLMFCGNAILFIIIH